jgi:hypothetical protein
MFMATHLVGFGAGGGPITVSSAAGEWTGATGSFTFSGDDITSTATDKAIKTNSTFGSAAWPLTFEFRVGATSDNANGPGLYDNAEDGTFNQNSNSGGMTSMTASWSVQPSTGQLKYGANNVGAAIGDLAGVTCKFEVEADGTVKFYSGGTLRHTFASGAAGKTVRICHANSNSSRTIHDVSWTYQA